VAFQFKAPGRLKRWMWTSAAGKFPMTRGSDGVWSVTTPPLVVGFHYYALDADGVA
jgi:hypothetical protein